LIVISLLKAHGIRYVIASPGNTNTALIGSIQKDPFLLSSLLWMNVLPPIWPVA